MPLLLHFHVRIDDYLRELRRFRAQEKRSNPGTDAYKITVRMENGSYQSYMQKSNPDMRVGDHVQVDHGVVRRYWKASQKHRSNKQPPIDADSRRYNSKPGVNQREVL